MQSLRAHYITHRVPYHFFDSENYCCSEESSNFCKFCKSIIEGFGMQCYAQGMTYYARLGYERSEDKVFTVSEALSGYERMFQERFGDDFLRL